VSLTDRVRLFAALLAVCALLVVTTATVLPGHGHDNDNARPCDICHSGHLPCLQATDAIELLAHMPVSWQQALEDLDRHVDSGSVIRAPRAPPVFFPA
jgi:hypothetical protein